MPVNPKKGEREEEFISRCIGEEVAAGYENPMAAAICYSYWRKDKMSKMTDATSKVMAKVKYDADFKGINLFADLEKGENDPCWENYVQVGTKDMDGREVPNCVPLSKQETKLEVEEGELNILGYHTKNFKLCPGATSLFGHLIEMPLEEDTIGMVRSAAQIADNVFHLEKLVVENGIATQHQYEEAVLLVDDFKDIMEEIDEEVGMVHDVTFMDGHIDVIKSYI